MSANLKNLAVAPGLEKISFHCNPKEGQAKEGSDYCTDALISHANKVLLKILQGRLHQYMSRELPDVQAAFRKSRDITLLTKVQIVKAIVFPVVMYGCESWTIKKADH